MNSSRLRRGAAAFALTLALGCGAHEPAHDAASTAAGAQAAAPATAAPTPSTAPLPGALVLRLGPSALDALASACAAQLAGAHALRLAPAACGLRATGFGPAPLFVTLSVGPLGRLRARAEGGDPARAGDLAWAIQRVLCRRLTPLSDGTRVLLTLRAAGVDRSGDALDVVLATDAPGALASRAAPDLRPAASLPLAHGAELLLSVSALARLRAAAAAVPAAALSATAGLPLTALGQRLDGHRLLSLVRKGGAGAPAGGAQ